MLSARRSLAWSFSQEFWSKATTIAGSICVARLLTPDEVGVFSIAMAAHFFISTFRDFGIGNYLIRESVLTDDKIRTAFGMSILIQWTLGLVLFVISPMIADVYERPGLSDVIFVICLTFLIAPIGQPASALLRREMRFNVLHHIAVISSVMGTGATITFALMGWSYMALAWGMFVGQVLQSFLVLIARPGHLRLRPNLSHLHDVLHFGGWLTASGVAMTVASEGMKLVLGGLLSPASLALYERAQQLPRHARQAMFKPIGRVLIPSFSKDIREGVSIGPSVKTYIASLTGVLWPMCFFMGFLSTPIISLLFGGNWLVAGEILPYLLVGMAIRACLPTPNEILIPYGRVRLLAFLRLAQAGFTLTLAVLGALHSLELFAQLQIVNALVFTVMNYFAIGGLIDVDMRELLKVYFRSSLVAVLVCIPALITFLIYSVDVPVQWLLANFASYPAFWLLAIHFLNHDLKDEVSYAANKTFRFLRGA